MTVINDQGEIDFESQNDFNDWLLTRIICLQGILMSNFDMTSQEINTLHAQAQAFRDQRRAETMKPNV